MSWTSPDPLTSLAKTRSIYITELQVFANTKRDELGQASITFIDQSVGKLFKLSAIEQLKTVVDNLAIDFGYVGGITHIDLLGRAYVNITIKYGNKVAHYPIINDLRQVLETIQEQEDYAVPTFVSSNWFSSVNSAKALAGWEVEVADPWAEDPCAAQLSSNGTLGFCDVGGEFLVDCDSNISGDFDAYLNHYTDKSISYWNTSYPYITYEGPFWGEHYPNPHGKKHYNSNIYDNIYNYVGASNGSPIVGDLELIVYKRDLRIPKTETHIVDAQIEVGRLPAVEGNKNYSIVATHGDIIYLVQRGFNQGSEVWDKSYVAVMSKNTGVFSTKTINLSDLLNLGNGALYNKYVLGTTWATDFNGNLVGTFIEVYEDNSNSRCYAGSGLIHISPSLTITISDIEQDSAPGVNLYFQPAHGCGQYHIQFPYSVSSIIGSGKNGIYYSKCVTHVGTQPFPPLPPRTVVINGTPLATTDYRGEELPTHSRGQFYSSEYWVSRCGEEPVLSAIEFDDITMDIPSNKTTFEWQHLPGAFSYKIKKRSSGNPTWLTIKSVSLDSIFTDGVVDSPIEYEYNSMLNDVYVRLDIECSQGLLSSSETYFPAILPGQPGSVTLSLFGLDKVNIAWTSPTSGAPTTGYLINIWDGATSTDIPVGLVNNYITGSYPSGTSLFIRVAATNSYGAGLWKYATSPITIP